MTIRNWRCWFHHDWCTYQGAFDNLGVFLDPGYTVVIAWKQCRRCAKSKLIHILK